MDDKAGFEPRQSANNGYNANAGYVPRQNGNNANTGCVPRQNGNNANTGCVPRQNGNNANTGYVPRQNNGNVPGNGGYVPRMPPSSEVITYCAKFYKRFGDKDNTFRKAKESEKVNGDDVRELVAKEDYKKVLAMVEKLKETYNRNSAIYEKKIAELRELVRKRKIVYLDRDGNVLDMTNRVLTGEKVAAIENENEILKKTAEKWRRIAIRTTNSEHKNAKAFCGFDVFSVREVKGGCTVLIESPVPVDTPEDDAIMLIKSCFPSGLMYGEDNLIQTIRLKQRQGDLWQFTVKSKEMIYREEMRSLIKSQVKPLRGRKHDEQL